MRERENIIRDAFILLIFVILCRQRKKSQKRRRSKSKKRKQSHSHSGNYPMVNTYIDQLSFIFDQPKIEKVTASTDYKKIVFEILQDVHKELVKNEILEFNELNILADYHCHNLEFIQSISQLPKDKTALLLNIFASMLQFAQKEYPTIDSYEQYEKYKEEIKAGKLQLLKKLISPYLKESPPTSLKVFTSEEVEKILNYYTSTYLMYSHIYELVFSKKQGTQLKKIEVFIDDPNIADPLTDAMYIGPTIPDKLPVEAKKELVSH